MAHRLDEQPSPPTTAPDGRKTGYLKYLEDTVRARAATAEPATDIAEALLELNQSGDVNREQLRHLLVAISEVKEATKQRAPSLARHPAYQNSANYPHVASPSTLPSSLVEADGKGGKGREHAGYVSRPLQIRTTLSEEDLEVWQNLQVEHDRREEGTANGDCDLRTWQALHAQQYSHSPTTYEDQSQYPYHQQQRNDSYPASSPRSDDYSTPRSGSYPSPQVDNVSTSLPKNYSASRSLLSHNFNVSNSSLSDRTAALGMPPSPWTKKSLHRTPSPQRPARHSLDGVVPTSTIARKVTASEDRLHHDHLHEQHHNARMDNTAHRHYHKSYVPSNANPIIQDQIPMSPYPASKPINASTSNLTTHIRNLSLGSESTSTATTTSTITPATGTATAKAIKLSKKEKKKAKAKAERAKDKDKDKPPKEKTQKKKGLTGIPDLKSGQDQTALGLMAWA